MTRAIILLPFILLAACDSGPQVTATNASVAEVADKVGSVRIDKASFRPGKWAVSGSIDDIQAPGVPAEMREEMKQAGRSIQGTESCITAADVKKPAPDFFTGNKSCRYDHFTMGDGKIDGRMRCSAAGGTQVTAMTGTYAPESYRMAMTTAMESPAGSTTGMEGITMKLTFEGKRIGDCDVASTKAAAK